MGRHVAWAAGLGERGHVHMCDVDGGAGVVVGSVLHDLLWNVRSEKGC